MKKRYTLREIVEMPINEYLMLEKCIKYGTIRLLGIPYKKKYEIRKELNGDIVITYD